MTSVRVQPDAIQQTLDNCRRALLAERTIAGHWAGELSSSALSTATASFALWLFARANPTAPEAAQCHSLAAAGAQWLVNHQNTDGGWGDTVLSPSNISTTALAWAALSAIAGKSAADQALPRARTWLIAAAGSLDPDVLAKAIAHRYGKDRTFSVPILTMCALAGCLGSGRTAWKHVRPLPFELATFPQSWFRFLRLPVVSYALPALIAMGQVRHHFAPPRNPLARIVRRCAVAPTLRKLRQIQPATGGFLEATPLTSFVAMSLVGAGQADHSVVHHAVEFLLHSTRPDGSWPIDANLATWVTTLSVNALSAGGDLNTLLPEHERAAIARWLTAQQHNQLHAYTGAAPGGWAWTDLPGGVPDADDTAGALIALRHLDLREAAGIQAATAGVRWLLGLQNRDGGIPTFCRGWGNLPFDRSACDLTAHAVVAWRLWRDFMPPTLAKAIDAATSRALKYLCDHQAADGSWEPLWFGNQLAPGEANRTVGTARVLSALANRQLLSRQPVQLAAQRALRWLLAAQHADGGFGGAPEIAPSIEETGHAVEALLRLRDTGQPFADIQALEEAITRGAAWLVRITHGGTRFPPAPIGLYFAKLWYFERLYPLIAATAALTRLQSLRGSEVPCSNGH